MSGEAIAAFLDAMEAAGVRPVEPIGQRLGSGLIRFRCEGDKPGRRNAWAILYLDGRPAGKFGCYRLGVAEKWRANSPVILSPAERREQQRKWREQAARRSQERRQAAEAAATRAEQRWASGVPVAADHAYLVRKGMTGEGLRQCGEALLVPMHDSAGRLWNVQTILSDGTKRFLKGGRTAGLMFAVGEPVGTLCVGEGVSTMAAVRAATGHPTVASFSADNLGPVARLLRQRWPVLDMVICADDDAHLVDHPTIKRNLGLEHARAAATAVGARLAVPPRGQQ